MRFSPPNCKLRRCVVASKRSSCETAGGQIKGRRPQSGDAARIWWAVSGQLPPRGLAWPRLLLEEDELPEDEEPLDDDEPLAEEREPE